MNSPSRESAFDKLERARRTLELPDRASIRQIKEKYHELSRLWRPDLCKEAPELCRQMQQRLNETYAVLMAYCNNFQYSFRREDVEAYPEGENLWWEQFGDV